METKKSKEIHYDFVCITKDNKKITNEWWDYSNKKWVGVNDILEYISQCEEKGLNSALILNNIKSELELKK